jgi:hypothetical protein
MQDLNIVSVYHNNPTTSTLTVANDNGISRDSVRRRLKDAGLRNRVPARKPVLLQRHRDLRLAFAEQFINFDFRNVAFLDEKVFQSSADGRVSLWRVNNTRYNENNVIPNRRSGRISCGVWGWMSSAGPGELCQVTGRLNSRDYIEILNDVLLPSLRVYYPSINPVYVVQDNCSFHNSRIVRHWIDQQEKIELLDDFPPKSPDLNPIENLWGLMAQQWDPTEARTKATLIQHCFGIWDSMRGLDHCYNMVMSMRNRLEDVRHARGGYTKY